MRRYMAGWPLIVLGAVGACLVWRLACGRKRPQRAVHGDADAPDRDHGQVRPAGPEARRTRTGPWDAVDEAADESFPASDPASFASPLRPGH